MDSTGSPYNKKLRVLVLTHPDLVPPEKPKAADLPGAPWKAEHEVAAALKKLGHEPQFVGVLDDLLPIQEAMVEHRAHIAFNLMEEFDGVAQFDQNVVSFLELLKLRYTGCNPRGLMLARDKALAKKVLSFHGIPTPPFQAFPRHHTVRRNKELGFPLIVKSLTEEASLGIAQSSVVHDDTKLAERVQFLHETYATDVIAERFIDGRELYVGVLGNRRTDCLPVWELRFPDAKVPRIATRKLKWDNRYRAKYGITSGPAKGLPPGIAEQAHRIARDSYRILGLNGYARFDFRLSTAGELYLIEANPNPHIGKDEDFAASAAHVGIEYRDLLSRILHLGLRWQPTRAA